MSDLGRMDWELLLRGAGAMQPRWVVNGNQAAGTSVSVRYANPQTVVPLVGASDQKNFVGARIVFGPGAGDVPSANLGFSTTIAGITSTVSNGIVTTTLTLADAVPSAMNNGDQFAIYPAQEVSVTSSDNIAQVGGVDVPTVNGVPTVPIVQEGSVSEGVPGDASPAQAQQIGGTDGTDLRVLLTDTDGTMHSNISKVGGTVAPTVAGIPRLPTAPAVTAIATLNDASGTTDATASTSTVALAANTVTRYLFFQNASTTSGDNIWVNFGDTATAGAGSILIGPGTALIYEQTIIPTQSVNVLSTVASVPYTLKYV